MFKITPREPTDDEIDRACAAGSFGTGREMMRIMLRAALNPPAEPEIAVTEKMLWVGIDAANAAVRATGVFLANPANSIGIAAAYRAMFAARPKPNTADQYPPRPGGAAEVADQRRRTSEMRGALDEGISSYGPASSGARGKYIHWRDGERKPNGILRYHCRKDDPR